MPWLLLCLLLCLKHYSSVTSLMLVSTATAQACSARLLHNFSQQTSVLPLSLLLAALRALSCMDVSLSFHTVIPPFLNNPHLFASIILLFKQFNVSLYTLCHYASNQGLCLRQISVLFFFMSSFKCAVSSSSQCK